MTRPRRLPPRVLRRLILSVVFGVAVGVAAWYLGMDAFHALGLGAAAAAFVACLSALGEAADLTWAVPAPEPRAGARRDIVQLGWALGSRGGRVSPEGPRRLRLVAERALAAHGLDLQDGAAGPELERLLGAEVLAVLRRGSTAAPPRTAFVAEVLQRLEALDDTAGPAATGRLTTAGAAATSAAAAGSAASGPSADVTPDRPTAHRATEESPRAR